MQDQTPTNQSSTQGPSPICPERRPHSDSADLATVLDAIVTLMHRYLAISQEQGWAVALWISMTYFMQVIKVAPLLIITAPERACGKSVLLTFVSNLVEKPLSVANMSAAFLYRAIELYAPTLLIDEADMFARQNDELKGLINAGHTPSSAFVGRIVKLGEALVPQLFSVWCAKALAGIQLERYLPDSTISRALLIILRRKLAGEQIERLRHADQGEFDELASKLARCAQDLAEQVANARPEMPEQLDDRAQDNWEPLFAIAYCAGAEWVERARAAALAISAPDLSPQNLGNELLADIKSILDSKMVARISTADLLTALTDDPEAPWATYNRGKPLTPRQLSRMLKAYEVHSKTVRFGSSTPKGFEYSQFKDAFARYLTQPLPAEQSPADEPKTPSGGDWPDAPECVF